MSVINHILKFLYVFKVPNRILPTGRYRHHFVAKISDKQQAHVDHRGNLQNKEKINSYHKSMN